MLKKKLERQLISLFEMVSWPGTHFSPGEREQHLLLEKLGFPHEVLVLIFSYYLPDVSAYHHTHVSEIRATCLPHWGDLARIARVSRLWSRAAREVLNRHVFLDSEPKARTWLNNNGNLQGPIVLILAGTVASHQADRIIATCSVGNTRHLGLIMEQPVTLESLYRRNLGGITSLTIGGRFQTNNMLTANHRLHFTLSQLAIHGHGLPLLLLGALIPDIALLTADELSNLSRENIIAEQLPPSSLWSLQVDLSPAYAALRQERMLPVRWLPGVTNRPPPLTLISLGDRDVYNYLPLSRQICVELPIDRSIAYVFRDHVPSIRSISYTGRDDPQFDIPGRSTYGSTWLVNLDSGSMHSNLRYGKALWRDAGVRFEIHERYGHLVPVSMADDRKIKALQMFDWLNKYI
ncbi:hypothetical protein RQP46_004648 [Phenoliferia psychrophenolica]